jgi:protoporphyrinogen oxidase
VRHFERSIVLNHWKGHWMTYPVQNHLAELPAAERDRALADLLRAHEQRPEGEPANYLEWCLQNYGGYLTGTFYADYTAKYWRVPMEELATDWLKGRLLPSELERIKAGATRRQEETQSVFASFHYPARGGYFQFFRGLYDGIPVTVNAQAVRVDPRRREVVFQDGRRETYERLVSTMPLPDLVAMTEGAPADVRDAASRLRHTQLLCVNMVVEATDLTKAHWFYLYGPDVEASRVKVISNLTPDAVPAGCTALQCEVFRRGDEAMPREEVAERTVRDVGRVLGFSRDRVRAMGTVHVSHAYPLSDVGRAERVRLVLDWLNGQGIRSIGLFGRWKFVWSDEAYRDGDTTAREWAKP